MVLTRKEPSSRAWESASSAGKVAVTIESPAHGRIAAQPVRKVIDPPGGILGAASRAQAQLPKTCR